MRRAACIFLAAILLPCLVLAWLAVRSEQDQQVILQHQQAIIDQGVVDTLAQNVRLQMDGVVADFVHATDRLLATASSPQDLADGFHRKIQQTWPLAEVGFAVDLRGTIYAPRASDGPAAQTFRKENESFLSNREDAEVYSNAQKQNEETQPVSVTTSAAPAISSENPAQPSPPPSLVDESAAAPTMDLHAVKSIDPRPTAGEAAPALSLTVAAAPDHPQGQARLQSATDSLSANAANSNAISNRTAISRVVAPPAAAPQDPGIAMEQRLQKAESRATAASAAPSAALSPEPSRSPSEPDLPRNASANVAANAELKAAISAGSAVELPTQSASLSAQSPPTSSQQIMRIERQVAPQASTRLPDVQLSNVVPAQSDFRQLIGQANSGSVARFLDDRLCLLVWSLPPRSTIVFGAQLQPARLVQKLLPLIRPEANRSSLDSSYGARADYCLALIDDKGHPVALSQKGFSADWKHPFVATEIGGVLPHWEAALYLIDPQRVSHSARVLHVTVGLIILLLIVAIIAGGTLIGADLGRQMRLAQQKTDFVSNVSHELKTPLTSIRMFADMLAEGRIEEPAKQATYLRIISAESARLTRLINNVLDFARQERGAPAGEQHPCDLVEVVRDVAATCEPHLQSAGVSLALEIESETLPLLADRDALSQIILNLISNAEKYGGGEIVLRARRQETKGGAMGCVDVLDRGPGIPPRRVETIFVAFKRLDDSLASGVPGSGLGLTLARRMARAHGGDVTYQPRAGGGSCFTLALPLALKKPSA